MTQPAKVQEPSMEEILASIRRIIADDEAKPAAAEKPASPAGGREAGRDEGYPAVGDRAGAEAGCRAEAAPAATAACARTGRQQQSGRHRRDAGEPRCGDARGRHPAGAARAEPTCSNSPTRWRCRSRRRAAATFNKVEPQDDIEFTEAARRARASRPMSRRRSRAPRQHRPDFIAFDRLRRRIRLQFAGQHRAEQQCADAGRSGQGNAAADAEILARRQSAGIGGADRQGRNRTGFARRALVPRLVQGGLGGRRSGPHSYLQTGVTAAPRCPDVSCQVDLRRCGGFLGRGPAPIASKPAATTLI